MPPQVLVITGPTASGKTRLSVLLAKALGGEVVSADSMQVYRGMDIGTAKPTEAEMDGVPHHMIDIADPDEDYSVARYVVDAAKCVDDILARGRLPILTGGTGLYIDSLLSGRSFAQSERAGSVRLELARRYETEGAEALWDELYAVDPETAARLHPNDKRRVLRALEVYKLTGQTISEHNLETKKTPPRYSWAKIALTDRNREDLYRRIDHRVDAMVEAGLEDEVRGLIWEKRADLNSTAMQAIGYKEMVWAIAGQVTMEEAVERIKQESRRYAKRQLSWLRRDEGVNWVYWDGKPDFSRAVQISTEFFSSSGIIEPGYK